MGNADWVDVDESDDEPETWAQRRIASLKKSLADDDFDDLGDTAEIQYYDQPLDNAHDSNGYYDDSNEDSRVMYAIAPTWWENLLARWQWVIPLTALLVPLLILAGGLAVLGALSDDDSESPPGAGVSEPAPAEDNTPVQGEWPPGVQFVEHTIPALIRDELAFAGAMQGYLFTGAAGDTWRIEVEPSSDSALDPVLHVYDPNGHILVTHDDHAQGAAEVSVLFLPQAGAYRVVIQAADEGLTTGEYWLSVGEE